MDLKILFVGVGFGGLALFIIWFLYIREVRKFAKSEVELDATLARVDAIEKATKEAKQNEKTVSNLTRDELRKRLQD